MANRAYLYTSSRADWNQEDVWSFQARPRYYDSRHSIPASWFFFFRPGDLKMLDVVGDRTTWQEVRLHAAKAPALQVFRERMPLLEKVVASDYSLSQYTGQLLKYLEAWPGEFLLMDPTEIAQDGELDYLKFFRVLQELEAPAPEPAALKEAIRETYNELAWSDESRFAMDVTGVTYWPLSDEP